jgi:hypothetical protein
MRRAWHTFEVFAIIEIFATLPSAFTPYRAASSAPLAAGHKLATARAVVHPPPSLTELAADLGDNLEPALAAAREAVHGALAN